MSLKISNQNASESFLYEIYRHMKNTSHHQTILSACTNNFKPRKCFSLQITRQNIMSRWWMLEYFTFSSQVSCFVSFCKLFVAHFFFSLRSNKSAREKIYKNIRIVLCFRSPHKRFSFFIRKSIHMFKHVTEFGERKKRLFGVRKQLKTRKRI